MKLPYSFYNRNTVEVARDLLGKTLVLRSTKGIITETEAYRGLDDPASHGYKMTPRSQIMFGSPGLVYVYFIYGMYHCLNFVTEEAGQPGAVLIRGLKLPEKHLSGPGKICKHLNIDKSHNGIDLTINDAFYLTDGIQVTSYQATPRIGITKAINHPWRFVMEEYRVN